MKTLVQIIFAVLLLSLFISGCKQKKPAFTEESLLGEWYTIKGDVETYSFLKDDSSYIFVGTQGMRPVVYGTWKINKDKFIIIMDNGTTTTYTFKLLNDTLTFNEGEEIYTLTEPIGIKYPETQVLVNISSDFSNLKFSAPQPADLSWGLWIDSLQSSKDIALKGYSISAGTTLSSGDITTISDYLRDYGFEPDTVYVTEICNGFWANNQLVTLCTSQDPEATNDSVYVKITSGLVIE
jgi:hypothetical protein